MFPIKQSYILILAIGVFSIINTEMGVIGILPLIASTYGVSISTAGLLVSLFALAVAISGPTLPLIFSGFNRKSVMVMVLSTFTLCNIVAAFATNFNVVMIARVLPAFMHPIYVSLAFSVAAGSVSPEQSTKAVSKILIGVSAGMVLGVPIVSYLAAISSLQIAMLSFALVNALALVATIVFIPSMPVQQRLSYSSQLGVLKQADVLWAITAVTLLNGAVFGVFSYMAEYLSSITRLSAALISLMLLIYGLANILGNIIAGRLLAQKPLSLVVSFPILLLAVYLLLFFVGKFTLPAACIILIWGVLGGAGANINQYWITKAAPQVPDFANGMFLVAANVGTTIGAAVCGLCIAILGTAYIPFVGIAFAVLGAAALYMRIETPRVTKPLISKSQQL